MKNYILPVAHWSNLMRMRVEAAWSALRPGPKPIRVLATACWHFPIYSQTFVYREVCELANQGFETRFVYSALDSRAHLPRGLGKLWSLKRRLILSDPTAELDMAHYRRRMPERVDALVRLISDAAGMTPEEVRAHEHFRHAFSFTRMVECWRADYIHSYFFYERTLFALVAAFLLGIPRGVSCYADHMLGDYPLKLIPLNLQSCDVVVATSERIRRELDGMTPGARSRVCVKPNAINVKEFAGSRSAARGPRSVCRLLCVSRIHPKKGLTYLVDAAAALRNQGCSIEVRILGEPDEHDPESRDYDLELRQRIARLGLESAVRLEGRKTGEEVRRYLAETDIFVLPSIELPNGDKDGIPTALLEAMAAGCAIVSTDAGSIPEVIDDGVEGYIVSQRDSAALADAIARLIGDEELCARASQAAVDRVLKQFDIAVCEAVLHDRVRAAVATARQLVAQRTPA